MVYAWEFEFFDSDGIVDAVPCGSLGGGGTFGSDLNDAIESAADFLACMVDDHLMGGIELPAPDFGHQPQHGGKITPWPSAASSATSPPSPQRMPRVCSVLAQHGYRN